MSDHYAQHPTHPSIVLRHGRIGLPKNKGPIRTVESLAQHLQSALAVELSTIPLYLTGQWTAPSNETVQFPEWPDFKPQPNSSVSGLIQHVAVEEMLHLCLVGNALRGINRNPILYDQSVVPDFPTFMLGRVPPLKLHIRPATQENIQTFVDVERPEPPCSPAQPDDYTSLGQFYRAIEEGFQYLAGPGHSQGLFDPKSKPFQFAPGAGDIWDPDTPGIGGIVEVLDLPSAMQALTTIVVQGEGDGEQFSDAKFPEPDHFRIFSRLRDPTKTPAWQVQHNIVTDPKTSTYKDPKIRQLSVTFDAAYCLLLITLQTLWTQSDTTIRNNIIGQSFWPVMTGILHPLANILMNQPIGKEVAAATFHYYAYNKTTSATKQFQGELATTISQFTWSDADKAALDKISTTAKGLIELSVPGASL